MQNNFTKTRNISIKPEDEKIIKEVQDELGVGLSAALRIIIRQWNAGRNKKAVAHVDETTGIWSHEGED